MVQIYATEPAIWWATQSPPVLLLHSQIWSVYRLHCSPPPCAHFFQPQSNLVQLIWWWSSRWGRFGGAVFVTNNRIPQISSLPMLWSPLHGWCDAISEMRNRKKTFLNAFFACNSDLTRVGNMNRRQPIRTIQKGLSNEVPWVCLGSMCAPGKIFALCIH